MRVTGTHRQTTSRNVGGEDLDIAYVAIATPIWLPMAIPKRLPPTKYHSYQMYLEIDIWKVTQE